MPRCPTYSFGEHLRAQALRPERLSPRAPSGPAQATAPWAPEDHRGGVGPALGVTAPQPPLLSAPIAPPAGRAQAPLAQAAAPAFFDDRLFPW